MRPIEVIISGWNKRRLGERNRLEDACKRLDQAFAALETAKECIEGHFEDGCSECRNALAVCNTALASTKRKGEP
jgi:hypothetical protein